MGIRSLAPWLLLAMVVAGCGEKQLPTAPLEGKVLYRGKPLEFGSVIFQPDVGPPARANIQPDGTFRLSTYRDHDGAVIGKHQVQIACYDSQRPGAKDASSKKEAGVGNPLIPEKYLRYDSSGLAVEVTAANEPVVFELRD